jgi:hypothetical protein
MTRLSSCRNALFLAVPERRGEDTPDGGIHLAILPGPRPGYSEHAGYCRSAAQTVIRRVERALVALLSLTVSTPATAKKPDSTEAKQWHNRWRV